MFNESRLWNLLYELVNYKRWAIIVDLDGITIGDLEEAETIIFEQTPRLALQKLVENHFPHLPFAIEELKFVNQQAYQDIIQAEREKIRMSINKRTHELVKEFEIGTKVFSERTGIKFSTYGTAYITNKTYEPFWVGLDSDDVYNSRLQDWCFHHNLTGNNDGSGYVNRVDKLLSEVFIEFSKIYSNNVKHFDEGLLHCTLTEVIEDASQALFKNYEDMVEALLSEENVVNIISSDETNIFYYNGEKQVETMD